MRVIVVMVILTIAGCANIDIQRVTTANEGTVHGVRYWRPAPYLSVTGNKDGLCVAKLIYLPNMKEEFVITPTGGFGSITFKPTLSDGWNLTALEATVDSKTSATDFLGAIAKMPGLTKDLREGPSMKPGIYKIIFDNDGNVSLSSSGAFAGAAACVSIMESGSATPSGKP